MTSQAQLLVKIPGKQSHLLDLNVEKVAKVSAKDVGSLVLKNTDNDFSPENITLLRAGSDLNVILEGDQKPSLIIKDYFDIVAPPALTGVAEDYQVYVYQPSQLDFSDNSTGYSFPSDKMEPALLAGKAIGDGTQIFTNPPKAEERSGISYDSLPWFLGIVGGVAAATGIGLAIRNHHRHHHNHHESSGNVSPPDAAASSTTNSVSSDSQAASDSSVATSSVQLNSAATTSQDQLLTVSHLSTSSLSALHATTTGTENASLLQTLSSSTTDSNYTVSESTIEGNGGHTVTTLLVTGSDLVLDLSSLSSAIQDVGIVNLNNHENQLTVGFNDVLKMGEEHIFTTTDDGKKQMVIQGGDSDTLNIESDGEKWTAGADQDVAGHIYHTYTAGNSVELLVDAHLSHVNII